MEKDNRDYSIGIGMLGAGLIGESHIDGLLRMPYIYNKPPAIPKLIKICEIDKQKAIEAFRRYNFLEYCTDWNELVKDNRIDILYNTAPNNLHAEVCISAARAGKHIVCEKPLARNAIEAREMLEAVKKAKVKHLCDFIFRMVPALAFAKKLVLEGKLGKIINFSASRLMDYLIDSNAPMTWRLSKKISGSGVVGDIMAHIIDLARWLCGEPISVIALNRIFIKERPLSVDKAKKIKVDVEDDSIAILEFDNGATGYIGASGIRAGHKTAFADIELNGELGTIHWNFEEMNNLYVYFRNEEPFETSGFHTIDISGNTYPYFDKWHYPGVRIGFNDLFINTAYSIINAVVNDTELEPMAATFEDGYKTAVICDAILKSAESGRKEKIEY